MSVEAPYPQTLHGFMRTRTRARNDTLRHYNSLSISAALAACPVTV